VNPAEAEELIRQRDAARSAASVAEAERLVAQNEVVKFGYRAMDAQKERDAAVAVVRGAFPWMMALAAGSSTQAAAAAGAWLDSFKQLRLPSDADAALRAMRGAAPAVRADERIALESAGVAHQLVEAIRERDEARSERDGAQAAVVISERVSAERLVLLKEARSALEPWRATHDQACADERAARRERDLARIESLGFRKERDAARSECHLLADEIAKQRAAARESLDVYIAHREELKAERDVLRASLATAVADRDEIHLARAAIIGDMAVVHGNLRTERDEALKERDEARANLARHVNVGRNATSACDASPTCWCDTCGVRRLRHALATFEAQHTPWPLADFVKRLADGADHLLNDHACDAHGYESLNAARDAARAWLEARSTTTRKETER
jgi:hypothetical protein